MIPSLAPVGYGLCALAFAGAAVFACLSRLEGSRKHLMALACLLTAVWAGTVVVGEWVESAGELVTPLEFVRAALWIAFLGVALGIGVPANRRTLAVAGAVLLAGFPLGGATLRAMHVPWAWVPVYFEMFLAVLGLLLLENLFRNCDAESRWGVKHVCFGLGAIFVYDFYYYADSALTLRFDPTLTATRGFVFALATPFLVLSMSRSASWRGSIRLSRHVVFHSAVLLGCGIYLLAISAAGTVLRSLGGGWGPVLQGIFFAAAVLIMVTAFSSASLRAHLRVLLSKHFFRDKHDYREVWLKFIQQVSREEGTASLHHRTLHAVADILDCPAGALWVFHPEDDAYFPSAVWNFGSNLPVTAAGTPLTRFLGERGWIIKLSEFKADPDRYEGLELPPWLAEHPRAWTVVPLIHHGHLEAFLILGSPRSAADLDWEDLDLLKTMGAQAASYLAEERTSRALVDARRLEEFNQRFAFVIHDIKNIVSQMSLMIENAKRYGDNPEFQRDMLATVENSAGRMRNMLVQLAANRRREAEGQVPLDLEPLILRVYQRWRLNHHNLAAGPLPGQVMVAVPEEKLVSVLDHLMQNAIEASDKDGRVELILRREANDAIIEVRDEGAGMDQDFIRTELFRPLDTWKSDGMGLGAFQARQMIRGMGGRLEVDSRLGAGTTMRVRLPLVIEHSPEQIRREERA